MGREEKNKESGKKVIVEDISVDNWHASTFAKVGLTLFLTVLACLLVFFLIYRYQGIFEAIERVLKAGESIIMGLVIAYLLNPVQSFFERVFQEKVLPRMKSQKNAKKISRVVGIICAILVLLLVIAFLIASIVPSVVNSIKSLADTMPGNVKSFLAWVRGLRFGTDEMTNAIQTGITEATTYIENWAADTVLPEAQTYVTRITTGVYSVIRSLLNFIVGIVVAVYVMAIKETLIGQSKKVIYAVFKPKRANMIIEVTRQAHRIFGGFITGKILDSVIIGLICYVGCLILRMPNSVLIAAIIGVTNIIPVFGPIIGAIPCVFLILVQSPIHALYFVIFVIALQQVDGNIIGPKILGDSTGLSSFWVMFAILLFGGLYGFMGMLLGVPVMGLIYYLARRLTNYRLRKKGLPVETEEYIGVHAVDEQGYKMIYREEKKTTEPGQSGKNDGQAASEDTNRQEGKEHEDR